MARSTILSRDELDFLLYDWLDTASLTTRPRYAEHDRETFDGVLDLSERLATDVFAPLNRLTDTEEPVVGPDGTVILPAGVADALRAYSESGLCSSVFDHEHGGMQLPFVVHAAGSLWFQAAATGLFAYPFLAEGVASLLTAHGTPDQIRLFARPVIEGRWYGTMCLSEPQAGSSLTDITTKAVRQDDGTYRVTGTKMWISAGDHELGENIVNLVLARTPGARSGVHGISLFIVPRYLVHDDGSLGERNDIALVSLNHKMGYRGTTNTVLNFGEKGGATGYLVGREGEGLAAMFHMMNEARVSVGAGATALGCTGYLHALEYARSRTQGRSLAAKDPEAPPVPIVDHPDVRRMLLAQKSYAEGALALVLYCARLVDEQHTAEGEQERTDAETLLSVLTPIAKSWPSQWCLKANDLAIQVHGGYGYTRDYPVEQFYRDNRLNPIHEGTHGIQALDLLGRKVIRANGAGLTLLASRMQATIERAQQDETAKQYAAQLQQRLEQLVATTMTLWSGRDPELALANATLYLEAMGHLVVAWLWLDQLLAAGRSTSRVAQGKRAAAQYFFRFELPAIGPQLDLLASLDRTTLDLDPADL